MPCKSPGVEDAGRSGVLAGLVGRERPRSTDDRGVIPSRRLATEARASRVSPEVATDRSRPFFGLRQHRGASGRVRSARTSSSGNGRRAVRGRLLGRPGPLADPIDQYASALMDSPPFRVPSAHQTW